MMCLGVLQNWDQCLVLKLDHIGGLAELGPMFGLKIGPYDVPWGLAELGPQVGPENGPYDVP
jgi:hypothetical protein